MLRFAFSVLCAVLPVLSGYASESPPAASIVVRPTATSGSFCDGLFEVACTKMAGCHWVKRESAQGQPLPAYCRPKIVATAKK
jgi:hypothetical protein